MTPPPPPFPPSSGPPFRPRKPFGPPGGGRGPGGPPSFGGGRGPGGPPSFGGGRGPGGPPSFGGGRGPGGPPRFGGGGRRGPGPAPGTVGRGVKIIYEDADVLVLDKPPGILSATMPDEDKPSVFGLVKDYARSRGGYRARAWIIHRLDREASGLLVFAKSEQAFEWLKEDFKAKRVHRLYLAVAEGEVTTSAGLETGPSSGSAQPSALAEPAEPATPGVEPKKFRQLPSGTLQSFVREGPNRKMESIPASAFRGTSLGFDEQGMPIGRSANPEVEAKLAVTHYRVLHVGEGRTLLQLRLETGRKNQIRVHLSEWKHPIIGDDMYGAKTDPIGRLALHAAELGFTHPTSGQSMRFKSPAPATFYRAVGMKPPANSPEELVQTPPPAATGPRLDTSWERVAGWYDQLIEEQQSDHFEKVIVPGTLRLVKPAAGMRVLDVACGNGALCETLAGVVATPESGGAVVGVDAAASLIERARAKSTSGARFEHLDARELAQDEVRQRLQLADFDAVTCVMALMNIDTLDPVFRGIAASLKPGGAFIAVMLHPAFRAPEQTAWGWDVPERGGPRRGDDEERRDWSRAVQYRRVDGYLSPRSTPIVMNPGRAARGEQPVTTLTFHRPLQAYIKAFTDAGLLVESLEEWPSQRRSEPGPRAEAENRARREIPMFLGVRAIKPAAPSR